MSPAAEGRRLFRPPTRDRQPRVGIVYPIEFSEAGHIGGGERYAIELAHALADVTDARLVTFGHERSSRREGNLRIEAFPRRPLIRGRLNNSANPLFLSALRDVDVVHVIGWHCIPVDVAILFARLTGKRIFVTDVGGGADVSLARLFPIGRLVDRFLFLTRYAASLYPDFSDRADVIYGGADTTKFLPDATPRERKVLYVGRIIPTKGIDYLIEAMPADVALMIVGRPYHLAYFDALRQAAEGKDVQFVTDADDARVLHEYRSSTVTVLPSVKRSRFGDYDVPEVLGLVLLESMASGTPVICTDVGPEPEIVTHGITGFIVPPNDAEAIRMHLDVLLADAEVAERMGRAARESVLDRFTWPTVAERCLAAYRRALA